MSSVSFFPSQVRQQVEKTTTALLDLQEKWGNEFPLNTDNGIYDAHPYLFLEAFPSLSPSDVQLLALAGRLFSQSLFAYDDVIDGMSSTMDALGAQAMQFEAYRLLFQLFPSDTAFWTRFRDYMITYARACMQEKHFASGKLSWREYTEPLAIEIAVAKTGIAKASIAGLVELARDDILYGPLVQSLNHYYVARQMWDDLYDWKEDIQNGIPSLLLARVLNERSYEDDCETTQNSLAREIYYGGHAEYVLQLALDSLDRADDLIAEIPDILWRRTIADLRHQCEELLCDVQRIVQDNLQRVRDQPAFTLNLPPAQNPWQRLAWDALDFVVQQWRLGFGEARHIMYLTRQEGFSSDQAYHYGDVFQRALIADALCDADLLLAGHLQPLIEREVGYLLDQRLSSGVGGWRYFPTVPELAPDADDLGQVMQVLLRSAHREAVVEYCEGPLAVLLRDNARPDGSFETWIVPATGRTAQQERQDAFNRSKWGAGPDNEVVANLLYALALYDPARFAETIQRGAAYLEGQQEVDGSWVSRWYDGPYYGTYVCLRLLATARPDSPSIEHAQNFLRQAQRADGGWGLAETSEALSTSLALLGLASVYKGDADDRERAERALDYLRGSQALDQGWLGVQFIRPRMNEPYISQTITHTYVLKAALAWYNIMSVL
ncbi:MAG TPA: hypothetical protein ENN19_10220, partial [Chloroflexi bacterium]|nr:hypothetical protein [Chloroflexota bacterium]